MWRFSRLALLILLAPLAAPAADLTFDVNGAVDYDSNVFRRDTKNNGKRDIEDDVLFRLRPGVEVHEDRGEDINFSAKYMLPVELSTKHSQLDDIDHVADGEVSYHPTDRTEIYAEDRFRYLRSTLVNRIVGGTATAPLVESGRDRVTVNDATLGIRYLFAPRLSGKLEGSHRLFRTTRDDRQDNVSYSVSADTFYTIDARHQVGLGAAYTLQQFQESDLVVNSRSNSVNVFAQWRWQIDETTGLDVAAGPSFIRVEQGPTAAITYLNPNPPPPTLTRPRISDSSDDSINVFAQAGVIKRWSPTLSTGARYTRSQGTASGVGGSVIADSVVATIDWKFRERWTATLRGDYIHRESISKLTQRTIEDDAKIENSRWGATARLSHLLARKTQIYAQVLYNNQNSNSSFGSSSDFQGYIVTLGFNHAFEPIKLW